LGFAAAASFSRFAFRMSSMLGGCFFCDAHPFFAFFGNKVGPRLSSSGGGGGGAFELGGGGGISLPCGGGGGGGAEFMSHRVSRAVGCVYLLRLLYYSCSKNAPGLDVSCGFGEVQRQTRQAVMFVAV
jgi:hypothetical protein